MKNGRFAIVNHIQQSNSIFNWEYESISVLVQTPANTAPQTVTTIATTIKQTCQRERDVDEFRCNFRNALGFMLSVWIASCWKCGKGEMVHYLPSKKCRQHTEWAGEELWWNTMRWLPITIIATWSMTWMSTTTHLSDRFRTLAEWYVYNTPPDQREREYIYLEIYEEVWN